MHVGTLIPHFKKGDFKRLFIPVPVRRTQEQIGKVYFELSAKIEQNRRTGRALEKLARAIFRAWFVDFEPVHAKAAGASSFPSMPQDVFDALPTRFGDSPLGPVPERWEAKVLADVVKLTMGQSPRSEFYNTEGRGLPFHQGVTDYGFRYPKDRVYCTAAGRLAEAGDVLLSVRAPVGRINVADKQIVLGRGIAGLRHREDQQSLLLYQMCHTFAEEDAIGDGTIFKAVNKNFLLTMPLLVPPRPFRNAFEALVRPMDEMIVASEIESSKLTELRDYLLPRLLSGQVRVRDAVKWADDPEGFDVAEHQSDAAAKRTRVSVQCNLTGPGDSQSGLGDDDHVQAGETRGDSVAVAEAGDEPPSMSIAGRPPVPIESWSTEEVMAAFRQAARNRGTMTREELLKRVAQRLGYQRLGSAIRERLKNHLRAALRRHIIAADGPEWVVAETTSMSDYELDELVDVLRSVMRKGQAMQREEVSRAVAAHLGFTRLVDTVQAPIKSAINAGIRRGILQYDRNTLWRVG